MIKKTSAKENKKASKTIVIFDAHAIIHRAYHALPSFARADGLPTGALYGLCSMLIKIIEELKPDYLVSAYDLPKPTFRHQAYEGYKAKRAKTDDDLKLQIEKSREIFSAFGVPCLDAEGFEADDIIGTLVEQLEKENDLKIIVASGDMDTLQLIKGNKVQVYTLKKGISDTILYDESAVKERYGFKPEQLVDYKGLRGDPSDNIIGIPGIGEKTATTIIQTFHSIEGLYKALEKDPKQGKEAGLSERVVSLILDHKDDAFFSKTLATIRRDAPIEYTLPKNFHKQELNTKGLLDTLSLYEFRSLVPRVKSLFSIKEAEASTGDVDQKILQEASIAMWVLYSENTTPSLEDILFRTKKDNIKDAYEFILEELGKKNILDLFQKVEKPLIPIIKSMHDRGIMIDKDHFETLKENMTAELLVIEKKVEVCTGFKINLNSPKQLSDLLFNKLGLKTKGKRKASGAFTTNAEALEEIHDAHEVIPLILKQRETQKLLTTYVEPLLSHVKEDGRVHAEFFQHGTTTGRFSSSNPNLQNIPTTGESDKDIKKGFVSAPGFVFIGSDYSQIELRVLAILSEDKKLIETFKKGEDVHTSVASRMFGVSLQEVTKDMRRIAKVINFGILFGMGVNALAKNLNTDRAQAQMFYTNYFETFPGVSKYIEETKEKAKKIGYTETLFGRRRYLPQINSPLPFIRAFAERMASNAPIQGTEADILKIAMLLIDEDLKKVGIKDKVHLLLQVHDELVYEAQEEVVKQATTIIESAMVLAFARSPIAVPTPPVPLAVSISTGKNLAELK